MITAEQAQVMMMLNANPHALPIIKATIIGYLTQRYQEDIEADPTITNPDAIMEIIGKGSGYMDDLIRDAGAVAADSV